MSRKKKLNCANHQKVGVFKGEFNWVRARLGPAENKQGFMKKDFRRYRCPRQG